jgi:glutamine amidotransferase
VDPALASLDDRPWVYFVHSLHGVPEDPDAVIATCEYGGTINAAFRRDNVVATQFHPEKSGRAGLQLLAAFTAVAAGVPAR